MQTQARAVAILGGNRIPFARANTAYRDSSNLEMLQAALTGLVERCQLQGRQLGMVCGGAVIKHSRDYNLTREAVLGTALDPRTPCIDMQMACATSMQAAINVANHIALGKVEVGIGCGADSISDVPIVVNERYRKFLLALGRARSLSERLLLLTRLRPGFLLPSPPDTREPRTLMSMGQHAEETAKLWRVSRQNQDELALVSHKNLATAYERGFFDDLLTPFQGLQRDNILRPDTSLEKLASLPPVFDRRSGAGTLTAGNSSALTDGAAATLLASDDWAREQQLPVLAYLRDYESAAVDFFGHPGSAHKDGLLLAPVFAIPRLLQRNALSLQDFDIYEIHEAFAAQVLATFKAWEDGSFCRERLGWDAPLGSIDRAKLNVTGSSIATGHPFAATGSRILATTAKLLAERGDGRALISICAAGGQGVCAILER